MEKEIGNLGEYIYLIQTRESLRCNDNIYKIGKTKQPHMKRMESYPKGSKLFIYIIVNDSTSSENDLIKIFKSRFKKSDQGNEYFYGNPIEMVQIITQYQAEHYKFEENINSQTVSQQQNVDSQSVAQSASQSTPKQINQQTSSSQSDSQTISQTTSSQTTPQPVSQQIIQQTSSSQQNIALSRQIPTENIAEAEYIVQNYKTNDMRKIKLIGSLKYIKNSANDFNKRLEKLNKILSMKQYLTTNSTKSKISNNVTKNNTNDKINVNTNVNSNVNKVTVDNKNSVNSNDTNVNANNKITNTNDVRTNTFNGLIKPINLSRYKFLLEDLIVKKMKLKRSCSVNIYVKLCSEANILEIKNIDVISANRRDIQTLQMEELKVGKYENAYKIELNQYDAPKFNKIKKDNINDYIIKINSLHRQKFKNKIWFETTFLLDSK